MSQVLQHASKNAPGVKYCHVARAPVRLTKAPISCMSTATQIFNENNEDTTQVRLPARRKRWQHKEAPYHLSWGKGIQKRISSARSTGSLN
eukprot:1161752-Pelagomonas_calceolata.AAC.7